MLNDMPSEIPFPQLRLSTKKPQRYWAKRQHYEETKFLHMRLHHSDGEISPKKFPSRIPVWTVSAFQAVGTGCSVGELPFLKARWQGQSPPLQTSCRGCDLPCTLLMSFILKLFWLHAELRGLGSTTWQARDALKCSTCPGCFLKKRNIKEAVRDCGVGWGNHRNNGLERVKWEKKIKKLFFNRNMYIHSDLFSLLLCSFQPRGHSLARKALLLFTVQ